MKNSITSTQTESEKIADIRKRLNEANRLGKQTTLGLAVNIIDIIRKYWSVKVLQAYVEFRTELQRAEDAGNNEAVKAAYAKFRQKAPEAYDYFLQLLKKENSDYYDYLGVTLGIYDSYTSKYG